jgi:hypothetical protein
MDGLSWRGLLISINNNVLREQYDMLWKQNKILREHISILWEQNIFLVETIFFSRMSLISHHRLSIFCFQRGIGM